jgi:hypothetical protein
MMGLKSKVAGIVAVASMISGQGAYAADSVYLGDCARARIVQQQSTIDNLMPHKRYEGGQRVQFANEKSLSCGLNSLIAYTLNEKSRSSSKVVFDVLRTDVMFGRESACPGPAVFRSTYSGTISFTTHLAPKDELCEVYILSEWDLNKSTDPSWKSKIAPRVIALEDGAFVIMQPASQDGAFWTPMSFTGVNP